MNTETSNSRFARLLQGVGGGSFFASGKPCRATYAFYMPLCDQTIKELLYVNIAELLNPRQLG